MKKKETDFLLNVFIHGETIDLCVPTMQYASDSTWYSWFNDLHVTRFLEQGIEINTPEKQVEFYKSLNNSNRLSLIISDKDCYIGTISLSGINLIKKTCEIAMLIGEKSHQPNSDMMALEAMARLTSFAFDKMGIERISAGQHHKLVKWQQKLELIGYKIDSLKKTGFRKGPEVADSVSIAITSEEYNSITSKRKALWDDVDSMRTRLSKLPSNPIVNKLREFYDTEIKNYYSYIFNL
jgi:RimJ/RimL family protein N-acetyltransferase